jgi:tetratricopeptide (TPR) repeat protein
MFAPTTLQGQCEPLANTAKAHISERNSYIDKPDTGKPEFFDEPAFTVAGVTDTTNLGGHASGMAQPRTTDALTRGIVSLSKESPASLGPAISLSATEKSLRDAANNDPGNFEANRRLGKLLANHGKAGEAIRYLEQAYQLRPQDYETGYELAYAYAEIGDYERARSRALALLAQQESSQDKAGQDNAGHDKAKLHHLLGEVEEKLSHPLEAVREYQRAADVDPSEPNLFDWGAELLLHRAPEPAIEVFGKGNRLFPQSPRMLVGLGVAWYSRGSYDEAARRLCEATDLNLGDPMAYPFLGKMLTTESGNAEGIVDRLGRFVRLQPENALANYYYAVGLWKQRKSPQDRENLAQMESLLEKAVRLDPKLGAGYLQLGLVYAERGDMPRTISAYKKATAATPQLAEAHYRLAQAYRQAREEAKAQQEMVSFKLVSKESADDDERQRREIQQFVYTLQSSVPRQ